MFQANRFSSIDRATATEEMRSIFEVLIRMIRKAQIFLFASSFGYICLRIAGSEAEYEKIYTSDASRFEKSLRLSASV
mgnify:CR=1 FL=1